MNYKKKIKKSSHPKLTFLLQVVEKELLKLNQEQKILKKENKIIYLIKNLNKS